MHIYNICSEYPTVVTPGGIGTCVRALSRWFVRQGHEVTVIGAYPVDINPMHHSDGGVRVLCVPVGNPDSTGNTESTPHVAWKLRQFIVSQIRSKPGDVLEGSDYLATLLLIPRIIPRVCRLHDGSLFTKLSQQKRLTLAEKLRLLASQRGDAFIAVSDWTAQCALKYCRFVRRQGVEVIENSIAKCFYDTSTKRVARRESKKEMSKPSPAAGFTPVPNVVSATKWHILFSPY